MEDSSEHCSGPTLIQIAELRNFVSQLSELRLKLEEKKRKSHNIIRSKMKDLHHLIDKWENIFLDTTSETLDEKIENLSKQEDKFNSFLSWIQEQSRSKSLSKIFPVHIDKNKDSDVNEDDNEDPLRSMNEELAGDEDEEEMPEEETIKNNFNIWKNIKFPLHPSGVSIDEVNADLWSEFGQLLEENRKSFKRSLLLVGGIIRAYMRRGHKKDEWVAMLRRLEARVETNQYNDYSDSDLVLSPSSYIPRDAYIFSSIWIAVNDVYKYRNDPSFKDSLSKQLSYLHDHFPAQVEFYLPQFVVCLLNNKDFPLTDFILKKCKEQFHFSVQVYFLTSSISQTGPQSWQKRGLKTLRKIIEQLPSISPSNKCTLDLLYNTNKKSSSEIVSDKTHVDDEESGDNRDTGVSNVQVCKSEGMAKNSPEEGLNADKGGEFADKVSSKDAQVESNNPLSEYEAELKRLTTIHKTNQLKRVEKILDIPSGKEYFFVQVKFARKLISISKKLGEIYGKSELYQSLLCQELKALDPYIKSGYSYLPHITNVRSRILNFILPECRPIPTYGRVLYKMVVEVVDLPIKYSKKMGDEYVKLNKDFSRLALSTDSNALFLSTINKRSRKGNLKFNRCQSLLIGKEEDAKNDNEGNSLTDNRGKKTKSFSFLRIGKFGITGDNTDSNKDKLPKSPSTGNYNLDMNENENRGCEDDDNENEKQQSDNSSDIDVNITTTTTYTNNNNTFGEHWRDLRKRIKANSIYSNLPHWDVRSYIIKYGDFVLQEQFVMQLIFQFQRIWDMENLSLKLFHYEITALSYQSGLIQVVPNSISLDKLKRNEESNGGDLSLLEVFKREWPAIEDFKRARSNFVSSMAAYSILCYLLQIKDRHNGNIMLDSEGHLFHLDFGYLLTRTIKFEKAPFKLTDEFVEVMGGCQSKSFKAYCNLCIKGFLAARKHYEKILLIVEMSLNGSGSMPCLDADNITTDLRRRFHLDWNDKMCEEYITSLISEARDNWRTQIYDTYQRIVNDIH